MSLFEDFNLFLLENSGTSAYAACALLDQNPENAVAAFGKPYKTYGNFFQRAAHVVTAPIFLSIFTAELMFEALKKAAQTLLDLITLDTDEAKEDGSDFVIASLVTIGFAFTTLASPFINAADLIGSLFVADESQVESSSELATGNTFKM